MGFFDIFSGALSRVTIFALGIMPYISASIILQLLTVVIPALQKLAKEGEAGRKKIIMYTRFGTIGISLVQSFGIAVGLEGLNQGAFIQQPGWSFRLMTMITLTAGTAFIMWLGEQITERGIGNGISLVIFAGIVAQFPNAIIQTVQLVQSGELAFLVVLGLIIVMVAVVAAIIFIERGAAASSGAVRQEGRGAEGLRGPEHAHPSQDQHVRRDSADFRLLDHHPAGDDDRVHRHQVGPGHRGAPVPPGRGSIRCSTWP